MLSHSRRRCGRLITRSTSTSAPAVSTGIGFVQVGNAPAFDEQDVLNNAYTSPVMTAVMAAFGEPEILSNTYTSRLDEIRIVLEGILVQQMIVQATLVDYFVAGAEEAGWSTEEISYHQQLGAMQVRWYGRRSTGVEPSGTIRQRGRVNSGLRRTPR